MHYRSTKTFRVTTLVVMYLTCIRFCGMEIAEPKLDFTQNVGSDLT